MRIGIDISQIVYKGSGIATYTEKIVENLLLSDKTNDYLLFGSSLRQKDILFDWSKQLNANKKIYPFPPLILETIWNKWHKFEIENLIGKVDVFHSSDWLQPPTKAKKVTTVHDLIIYRYPESFTKRGGHDIVENQKRRLAWVKRECDLIMADSMDTKNDLINYLKIEEKKIKVVYLAADKSFVKQSETEIKRVREKFNIKNDYVLCVGTREPRKNIEGVVKAFEMIKDTNLKLVIAGKFGWGEEKQLNANILGFVPQEDLPALYSGARCFVYPSFYEGFGLPVLEAMSCGCPVITTNRGSLKEIAGKAAILVNPEKPNEIAEGIKQMTTDQRHKLIKLGLTQASKFNWEKTTREVLQVYEEVYG